MEDTMRDLLDKLSQLEQPIKEQSVPEIGDAFGISLSEDFEIATEIVGFTSDGIVVELDDEAQTMLESRGVRFFEGYLEENKKKGSHGKACWKGYRRVGTDGCVKVKEDKELDESGLQYYTGVKKHGKEYMKKAAQAGREGASQEELGRLKDKYSKAEKNKKTKEDFDIDEAEYQGRDVPLGKKMPGDVKKYKVYVRKPNGNIVKVNFGDKKMRIKKSNPARRKSFRARHNCKNPGPRWKARYWSCRNW